MIQLVPFLKAVIIFGDFGLEFVEIRQLYFVLVIQIKNPKKKHIHDKFGAGV